MARHENSGLTLGHTAVPTTEELQQAIEQAGGELRIPDPPRPVRSRIRRAIYALINGNELAEGTRLRHTGRDKGDLVISIVTTEEEPRLAPKPEPIPVPDSLRACHALIKATREAAQADRDGWIDTRTTIGVAHIRLTRGQLHRALLLLQGLVSEAQRRGYKIRTKDAYRCNGGLHIEIAGHGYEICVKELTKRREHKTTTQEAAALRRNQYVYQPRWDYLPTGRLEIRDDHDYYRPPLASDRERWKLEDRLGRVLERLEAKAERDDEQDRELKRQEEARLLAWEEALGRAKEQLAQEHRKNWMVRQLDDKRLAEDARAFVEATKIAADLCEDDRLWLKWVAQYADSIDPIGRPLAPPPPPEPSPDRLKPYLGRWSPYGPDRTFYG